MPNSNSVKQERRNQLDPKSQGLAQSVPQLPGGPPNNPMNDNEIFNHPLPSMDSLGAQTPNGHYTNSQFPVQINGPSGQPQFIVNGRGNNSMFAYNNQIQPPVFNDIGFSDMEAFRYGQDAEKRGLAISGKLAKVGIIGQSATTAPGAFPSEMNAQSEWTLRLKGGAIAQGGKGKGTGRGAQNGGPRTA